MFGLYALTLKETIAGDEEAAVSEIQVMADAIIDAEMVKKMHFLLSSIEIEIYRPGI